eukprot:1326369-Amorphochlora_amoeboformis.AAC.3
MNSHADSHAVVTIHLCNTGIEAYLPEVFGEMIILQRRLYMHRTHEKAYLQEAGGPRENIESLCDSGV